MKLTQKTADILAAVQLSYSSTFKEIANITGHKEHTVRYAMGQLRANGIIEPYAFLNIDLLGYIKYFALVSLTPGKTRADEDFLRFLKESDLVSWLLEVGGDYQYGFCICVRSSQQAYDFLTRLSKEFGDIIVEKSVATIVSHAIFGRKYLSKKVQPKTAVYAGESNALLKGRYELDAIDKKILSGLSSCRFFTNTDAARALNIPTTTFESRLAKLQTKEILVRQIYGINVQELGILQFRLLIHCRGWLPSLQKKLYLYFKQHRQIVSAVTYLGAWDFDCRVEVENPLEVTKIRQELFERFKSELLSIKVIPQFREQKFNMYPFSVEDE
jgi:DNA-binding Lrp family transcriptional regulator